MKTKKIFTLILVFLSINSYSFNNLNYGFKRFIDNTFCFDDSYSSGNKFELTLEDGGKAKIVIKNRNNEIIRTGSGTWSGQNDGFGGNAPVINLILSTGRLKFTAVVDGSSINMLIDSKNNQWLKCRKSESVKTNSSSNGDDGKSSAEMMAEMAQMSKEREKFQKEYSARVAAAKITPFSVFKGKWIRNDEQVSIKITEIPYALKFNNSSLKYEYSDSLKTWELPNSIEKDLRFQPGEKKNLLKLTIDEPWFLKDFVGIVVQRDVVINSQIIYPPYTFLEFVNNNNDEMISFKITPKNSIQKGDLIYSKFIKGEWINQGIFSREYSGWSGPFNLMLEQEKIVLPPKKVEPLVVTTKDNSKNEVKNGIPFEQPIVKKKVIADLTSQNTVLKIGTQLWMSKNLDVNKFANGDIIPEAKSKEEWEQAGENGKPAWCYYDNDPINGAKYGKLYNWYAVNDPRGLAPTGWHIPSDKEWTTLVNYLGGESIATNKMKSTHGWDENGNGNNQSAFSALPGGFRYGYGSFDSGGYYTTWWSSTELDTDSDQIITRSLNYDRTSTLEIVHNRKKYGFSVRCVKN
jgi:uncharacterized protein (TIGR02145 family)